MSSAWVLLFAGLLAEGRSSVLIKSRGNVLHPQPLEAEPASC
ncbi:MAG: hypothetical protein ACM37W_10310 [Actinomycetota bacterium]